MKRELSPFEQLSHSTVRIETDYPDGGRGTGSAFFYRFAVQSEQHVPVIVTNRHVIQGASRGRFLLTLQDADGMPDYGKHEAFEFDSFESRWIPHPDPNVDLAVMPIAPLHHYADAKGLKFFCVSFDDSLLPSPDDIKDFVGVESVTMVGYPNGLWDRKNNLPIFRRGVLASAYDKDWNGKKEFLIDVACFPGSSGSPVLVFDAGSYLTRNSIVMGSRVKLLGVLYAGPQHTVEGQVKVVTIPVQQKAVSIAGIPNNLGIVLKASLLNDFDTLFRQNLKAQQGVAPNA